METIFEYNLRDILEEINGEVDLIHYWVKINLLEQCVPVSIDPLNVRDDSLEVSDGEIEMVIDDGKVVVTWATI